MKLRDLKRVIDNASDAALDCDVCIIMSGVVDQAEVAGGVSDPVHDTHVFDVSYMESGDVFCISSGL